jgi:zinc protease
VLLWPTPGAPAAAVQAWVDAGAADERAGETGAAHMLEHVLFKGTARRKVGAIAHEIEAAGGDINAWTSYEQTVFHTVVPARELHTGLDVVADALQHPAFDAEEFERERRVVLDELRQSEDDAGRALMSELVQATFPDHPFGRSIAGKADDVRGLARDRVKDFFRREYVASNITLVVVGDFQPEPVLAMIREQWSGAPASSTSAAARAASRVPPPPPGKTPRVVTLSRDVHETQLAIAFRIPGLTSDDVPALDAVAAILGQGDASRLELRVHRVSHLVSGVTAYTWTPRGPGLLVVRAALPAGVAPEDATRALLAEVFAMGGAPPAEDELRRARARLEAGAVYSKETAEGLARKLGFFETVAGGAEREERYLDGVRRLDGERVRAVAAKYLRAATMTMVALTPRQGGAAVAIDDLGAGLRGRLERLSLEEDRRAVVKAEAAAAAPRAKVARKTLGSGVRVIVKRDPSLPIIAIRAAWAGGQRFELPSTAGVHRLLAGTITRGCGQRSGDAIATELESMAGALSGFSGRNSFGIREEILATSWRVGLERLAECLVNPRFPTEELERERRAAVEDRAAREDDPAALAFRMLDERFWKVHPYRLDPLGSAETLAAFDSKGVDDFYRSRYPLATLTIAIVGDVNADEVFDELERLLPAPGAKVISPPAPPARELPERAAAPREVYASLPLEQAHIVIGFPGVALDDPDRYALDVAAALLSGQGGRLFRALRERHALAYRTSAFSFEGQDPGYFAIYVATSPDNLSAVRAEIEQEIAALRDAPPDPDELDRARRWLIGNHELGLQRRADLAAAIALGEAYGLGWDAHEKYAERVAAIDAAAVQQAARAHLDWDLAVIAVVQPPAMTPGAAKRAVGKKLKAPPAKKSTTPRGRPTSAPKVTGAPRAGRAARPARRPARRGPRTRV